MKISNSPQNYINQTYTNQGNATANTQVKTEKAADETVSDSINLSPKTWDLQKISAAMDTPPPERTNLVAELKQQVQAGLYTVDAKQVAEKMTGSGMNELV
jgi:flagellar biosynthesis anti-sigma factor FlgM